MTLDELLIKHEGKKNKVYLCPAGKRTIGIGHNIDGKGLQEDIEAFLEDEGYITDEMINMLLQQDVEDATSDCKKLYPKFEEFTTNRQYALIDFLFNVGFSTASKFIKTNSLINQGKWKEASENLLKSLYAQQVKNRAQEIAKMLEEG